MRGEKRKRPKTEERVLKKGEEKGNQTERGKSDLRWEGRRQDEKIGSERREHSEEKIRGK